MLVRTVAALTALLWLLTPAAALAQASPSPGKPDVTGHLPSGTWLLVVVAVGLAVYVSYRLGRKQDTGARRREGPISRALSEPTRRDG
jgi:hypothetical protein